MPGRPRASAGLLVVALAVAGCSDGGDDRGAPADSEAAPTTATTEATTTTAALQGRPLVVVEQGVSSFPDPVDPRATLGGYGVVLQNPNRTVMATGVRVVTRVLDPTGAELLVDSALLNGILPQQRMAVGRTLIEPIEDPTTLEVKVEVAAWLRPTARGRLVAEDIVTEPEEAGGSVTKFTLRSSWPELEEGVDVTALYRAEDGRILGAESMTFDVPVDDPTEGQIRLLSPIPDLARTEVYVGRGFAALTTG